MSQFSVFTVGRNTGGTDQGGGGGNIVAFVEKTKKAEKMVQSCLYKEQPKRSLLFI